MNFIGHLHVARWHSLEPGFALGAMLPDFAGMARIKLGRPSDALVREGIALHHRTDAVFHQQPVFVGLMQQTLAALVARGVARGPARAVGHVGVELLIDGELVHSSGNGAAYLRALEAGALLADDPELSSEARRGLALIHERLRTYGVPYDYRNTDTVVRRLSRALSGRSRLALSAQDAQVVAEVLPAIQRQVAGAVDELVAAVRHALLNEGVLAD